MIKTIIDIKNFSNRKDLENSLEDRTSTFKKDLEIRGTLEELARLNLSPRTLVFGIKCVATDFQEIKKENKLKPQRGEIKKYGINLND